MHVAHGDVHTDGLADGCPACAEVAKNPFANADDHVLRELLALALEPERLNVLRSQAEGVAAANVLTHLERTGRLCETGGDLVADYLRQRWRLEAEIRPRGWLRDQSP